ncbi:MAG: type II toxin-antitoxin system VapC family toxin [Candidatus Thioglobus sp.]|nr:type II toxin-antitoxin system VapC family toxin [Candidatus Thioglobus sp.]
MKYIVDTHIFIWLIRSAEKLTPQQLQVLKNASDNIYIVNISFWEIAIKHSVGKLDLFGFAPDELPKVAQELNLKIIDINSQTMANSYKLQQIPKHNDPFDRLLIWFCIENNYTFISADNKLNAYQKQGLLWI